MIDDSYNDGYTEEHDGILFRRLLPRDREAVVSLVKSRQSDLAYEKLFSPPHVLTVSEFSDDTKQELFTRLMQWPHEDADRKNLIEGVSLYCTNPLLSVRDCNTCRKWWFVEETGKVAKVGGRYLPRPAHAKTACDTERGCVKGHYSQPREMNARNRQALNHYLEWEGVGCPHPECPIMRRNWMWISTIIRRYGHPGIHAAVRGESGH